MRALEDLVNVEVPAWPALQEALGRAAVELDVQPGGDGASLLQLQVSAGSALGAMVLHCGGLVLDGGWLRIFGGRPSSLQGALPSLAAVNRFPATVDPAWRPQDALVVGHDVLGGVFALNTHDPAAAGRPGAPGQMTYFAPDSLEWEAMDMGYGSWLTWTLTDRLAHFYEGLRWPGWQQETANLTTAEGITVYPFLWSKQAQDDLAATTRAPAPMAELLTTHQDFCQQMGLPAPGFLGAV
ncbi:DUF2625 family protein [Streptomyces sp. NPDC126514]|uniref:DUF2625 family protein n=1 Tax=Streptomyces sp. NPDC126514 TaxID=3155210 RepID=UPI0033233D34